MQSKVAAELTRRAFGRGAEQRMEARKLIRRRVSSVQIVDIGEAGSDRMSGVHPCSEQGAIEPAEQRSIRTRLRFQLGGTDRRLRRRIVFHVALATSNTREVMFVVHPFLV